MKFEQNWRQKFFWQRRVPPLDFSAFYLKSSFLPIKALKLRWQMVFLTNSEFYNMYLLKQTSWHFLFRLYNPTAQCDISAKCNGDFRDWALSWVLNWFLKKILFAVKYIFWETNFKLSTASKNCSITLAAPCIHTVCHIG